MPDFEPQGPVSYFIGLAAEPFHPKYKTQNNAPSEDLGPREAALAEASHGAAFIVLPLVVLMRSGGLDLPFPWFPLAMVGLMILGGFWLYNGAIFSVGWRDPKLIALAVIRTGLAVAFFRVIAGEHFAPLLSEPLSLVGLWLLVTALTKLYLLLRGFPTGPWPAPGMPHGKAPFVNPKAAAKGLKQ